MSDVKMRVRPAAEGWGLECDLPIEPLYFRSGARAEDVARRLAIHLSDVGHDVTLVIRDRAQREVSTQKYYSI